MARIRTIKPEFYRHEELQNLELQHKGKYPMFVFAGLLNHCDKNGVFPWKPKILKLDILPFLKFDMEDTLNILETAGQIVKFTEKNKEYGFIQTFLQHQRISGKELQEEAKYPLPNHLQNQLHLGNREALGKHWGSIRDEPERQERERERERERNGTYMSPGNIKTGKDDKPFESFWEEYPARNGKKLLKAEAERLFAKIKDGDIELIMQAVRNYANSKGCRNGYAKDAVRFLRNNFWRDWLEPEKKQPLPEFKNQALVEKLKQEGRL